MLVVFYYTAPFTIARQRPVPKGAEGAPGKANVPLLISVVFMMLFCTTFILSVHSLVGEGKRQLWS